MTTLGDLVMKELTEMITQPPIKVEMSRVLAYMLISQCQLAARHPSNDGISKQQVMEFIKSLGQQICEPGSAVATSIAMGLDPACDVPRDPDHAARRPPPSADPSSS